MSPLISFLPIFKAQSHYGRTGWHQRWPEPFRYLTTTVSFLDSSHSHWNRDRRRGQCAQNRVSAIMNKRFVFEAARICCEFPVLSIVPIYLFAVSKWVPPGAATTGAHLRHGSAVGGNAANWPAELQTGSTERCFSSSLLLHCSVSSVISESESLRLFSILNMAHFHNAAPDVAALALSGDWAAEFLSGPESTSAPGVASLADAADADWTREFIAEAAGSRRSTQFSFLPRSDSVMSVKATANVPPVWGLTALLLLCLRSRTLGWGISGTIGGEVVAGRSWRQGEWMVRAIE